jgi:DNA modification methylase
VNPSFVWGDVEYYSADCFEFLKTCEPHSFHGVVTDPPYGLVEYTDKEVAKRRNGYGGVWRIPPSIGGHKRAPLPRFTTLSRRELYGIYRYFRKWGEMLEPTLVPGAHVLVASNPLVCHILSVALHRVGFERRGEIIRLVQTMRGGDRPKNAEDEYADVSVMPKSQHEPWVLFRKPLEGRVQDNLRVYGTGGLRRIGDDLPFGDVIKSSPTRPEERLLAPHPSLKPQAFLRQVVRAILPLGEGIVLDPFAGSGSTLAAAEAVGYISTGVDSDPVNLKLARTAIPALCDYGSADVDEEAA